MVKHMLGQNLDEMKAVYEALKDTIAPMDKLTNIACDGMVYCWSDKEVHLIKAAMTLLVDTGGVMNFQIGALTKREVAVEMSQEATRLA